MSGSIDTVFFNSKRNNVKRLVFLFLIGTFLSKAQTKKIIYGADLQSANEAKYPGAEILQGNVKMTHEGIVLTCNKALYFKKKNFFRAVGNVLIKQGDTITQTSNFADYDANDKQALSWGNVILTDPTMTLSTDTLHFDRVNQKLYYQSFGTIKDETNTLTSKNGKYYLNNKKFTATTRVNVVNPKHHLTSTHLDYYTDSGHTYLYGPSTITNSENDNKLYCEKGFYNTKTDISYFVKNSKLFLRERTVEGDSLYYDKNRGFASATNQIRIIDTLKNFITKGNYAELFELKDSMFVVKRALAISVVDKDSTFIHGDTLLVTGKPEKRIVRIYHNAKIYKSDLQGKCDSIHTNQATGVTKLFKKPVLWAEKNQITGTVIHLLTDLETEKIDSLKVIGNGFIVSKDTVSESDFNQIKGRNILGKFKDNKIKILNVDGNAESVYFNRKEETQELETITKETSSSIEFTLENGEIQTIKYIKKSDGKSYPPSQLPVNSRNLEGLLWRERERPINKEAVFLKDKVIPKDTILPKKLQSKKKLLSNNTAIKEIDVDIDN